MLDAGSMPGDTSMESEMGVTPADYNKKNMRFSRGIFGQSSDLKETEQKEVSESSSSSEGGNELI